MEEKSKQELKESSNKELKVSSGSEKRLIKHGSSCSTAVTVESDWETYLEGENPAMVSLNPWDLYLAFRNAKIITVEPVIFLYMFGTYLYFPLYQQYFLNRYSLDVLQNTSYLYTNETRCINKSEVNNYSLNNNTYDEVVTHNASNLFIYTSLANRILSIAVTMILGPLSDRYGRRLPMMLVAVGATLQGLLGLAIVHFTLNMYLFILGGAIAGLFGDFASVLMACFSYISDISSGRWRTVRIGLAESMIFMAGLLAEGLGGLWFQKLNCKLASPLLLFIACNVTIVLYTLIFLPESVTSDERRRKNAGKPKGLKSLLRGASIFCCCIREYSVWRLWFSIVPVAILVINMAGATSIGVFFFSDLSWSPGRIGAYQATAMGSHMVALMVVLPILVALKMPDMLISLTGIFFSCTMNLFIGLSRRTYQLFIVAVVQGMDAVMFPPLRGYMSKIVHVEDQGALFSVIACVESLATLVSIVYTYILPKTIDHHMTPGMAYIIMAALGLVPIPFISILLFHWCKAKCFTARMGANHLKNANTSQSEKAPILSAHQNQYGGCVDAEGTSAPPPYSQGGTEDHSSESPPGCEKDWTGGVN